MASAIIEVRNKLIIPSPEKRTWLEHLFDYNTRGRTMAPNSFFNRLLLERDERGNLKSVPEEITAVAPWYTGTAFVVGAKGKPLGKSVESECEFNGSKKTVIYRPDKEDQGSWDTMLICDQGFESCMPPSKWHKGAPETSINIELLNAAYNYPRPILDMEEMVNASEIIIRFNGEIRQFMFNQRSGIMEAFVGENTYYSISDSAASGFLARGFRWGHTIDSPEALIYANRRLVLADINPSARRGVLGFAPEEAKPEEPTQTPSEA